MAGELLTIEETIERLKVSRSTLYRWIHEGRITAVRLGGANGPIRLRESDLDAAAQEIYPQGPGVLPGQRRLDMDADNDDDEDAASAG